MTLLKVILCFLLLLKSEVFAAVDPFSAYLQAFGHIRDGNRLILKAVVAAPRALEVHNVELLVQKSIESELPAPESLANFLKHLIVHIIESIGVFADLEELPQLLLRLVLGVEVHLQLLLQLLPPLVLLLLPVSHFRLLLSHIFRVLPEQCRLVLVQSVLLSLLLLVELVPRLTLMLGLLLEELEEGEVLRVHPLLLQVQSLLLPDHSLFVEFLLKHLLLCHQLLSRGEGLLARGELDWLLLFICPLVLVEVD